MSTLKKTVDLQKLVQNPTSLKLLILHTPFTLEISSLWRCSNLIKLDLSKNNLERFPHIGNLVNLKFMFIHQNKLDHHILRGIFYAEDQPTPSYSPLSNSIVWVTFWGNKNQFLARHFLINQTSVIAVDNYMVVSQQRKHSVLQSEIQPFSQKTDISYILQNNPILSKNASQEQYMNQFWQQMRLLRRKKQQICPAIKVQKLFRGWIMRKKLADKKYQIMHNKQLKKKSFQIWKKQINFHKKLYRYLLKRNKQHYLLPLKQMRIQSIKQKMLQWASRAKKKVLLRKLSLQKQMNFYHILRSNMLMFKSLYTQLQIQKSQFLVIDIESFKQCYKAIETFNNVFNGENTFQIVKNTAYTVRQLNEGMIKKQFAKYLSINQRSYTIRLNYNKEIFNRPNNKKCLLLGQNICHVSGHSTILRPLFKNQHKLHFNSEQMKKMKKISNNLQKKQKMLFQDFVLIKGSPRILKDIIRCVYYINCRFVPIKDNEFLGQGKRVSIFSQYSINKLSSVIVIQKFWRGYIFRKRQKYNAQLCAKQFRAVIKIQRWVRSLPLKKIYQFKRKAYRILRLVDKPYFFIQVGDYLRCIQQIQNQNDSYLQRMRFLEQNIAPYLDYATKKITLYWDYQKICEKRYADTVKYCYQNKKCLFNESFIKDIFKCQQISEAFSDPLVKDEKNDYQKGDFSHLFHFNTLNSIIKTNSVSWIKICCNSVQQTKLRLLGILLQSFSFKKGIKLNIHINQFKQIKNYPMKNILNDQNIFITKDDVDLQQNVNQIKKFVFKSKLYLKQDIQDKPKKIEQNLIIFIHDPIKITKINKNVIHGDSVISQSSQIIKSNSQIHKSKKKIHITIQHMTLDNKEQNKPQGNSINVKRQIKKRQQLSRSNTQKSDLLPNPLKRILPLKKQIRSYKHQKRIKTKVRQPSFMLDNANKNQRVQTQPDIFDNIKKNQRIQTQPDLSIEQKSQYAGQKSQKSLVNNYSSVKQKMKKQYLYRKNLTKSNKQELQFHKNFMNLNNFLQQQGVYQQRRRIKTQIQLQNYQTANRIRTSFQKSTSEIEKFKQKRIQKVEEDIRQHKLMLQNHRKIKQQKKQEIQRLKSVERQKRLKSNTKIPRLKVSFAQQCFPIINRSYQKDVYVQFSSQNKIGDKNQQKGKNKFIIS